MEAQADRIVFRPFELDMVAGELLKHGSRVRLSGQPLRILALLLIERGKVISYERFKEDIWKAGTFVDFDHGLHSAVNKLRRALGDSAESPRYIETVPGRGYRFIGSLEPVASEAQPVMASGPVDALAPAVAGPGRVWWFAAAACLIVAAATAWRLGRPILAPAP